jgi:hypothetical protein
MAYGHPSQIGNQKIMGTLGFVNPDFHRLMTIPQNTKKTIQLLTRNAHMGVSSKWGSPSDHPIIQIDHFRWGG